MKKAAIILMGICLCPLHTVAGQRLRRQVLRPLRSKAPSTQQYRIPTWSRYGPNMRR